MDPTVKQGKREVDEVMKDKTLSIEDKKLTLRNMLNIYSISKPMVLYIEKCLNEKISCESNLAIINNKEKTKESSLKTNIIHQNKEKKEQAKNIQKTDIPKANIQQKNKKQPLKMKLVF